MACTLEGGPVTWSGGRDAEGYTTYKIVHRVRQGDAGDGPDQALQTPGLPVPGSSWAFGNDDNPWVICQPSAEAKPEVTDGAPSQYFLVENTFTNKPPSSNSYKCQDDKIEDPLLLPAEISSSSTRYTEEATHDRFGNPVVNSAFEQIRGPHNEWDANRSEVTIQQNVADAYQADELPTQMIDSLNDAELWGYPARAVKLSAKTWQHRVMGNCNAYYQRTLKFEIRIKWGYYEDMAGGGLRFVRDDIDGEMFPDWDRDMLDEGTKALNGEWDRDDGHWTLLPVDEFGTLPDPYNPGHYNKYKDRQGENAKVILDGYGLPYDPDLVPTTDECAECDDTPITWRLDNPDGNISLVHTAGCRWASAVLPNGDAWVLEGPTANNPKWTLTNLFNANGIFWEKDPALWDCSGPNTLRQEAFNAPGFQVNYNTVRPLVTSEPGSIHVEKYGESDFLELDIPTVL